MVKTAEWRLAFICAMSLLLLVAFIPHARSSSFSEKPDSGLMPFVLSGSDLPRLSPMELSASMEFFGGLLERLDLIEVAGVSADFIADTREEVTLASSGELVLDEALAGTMVSRSDFNLAINAEAPQQCKIAERSDYNYAAMAEAECTCELYQRNPAVRFGKASAKEFHWVKSCKKSRFKAS